MTSTEPKSTKGPSIKNKNGLTPKQQAFTEAVVGQIQAGEQPNLTEAVMGTYNVKDRNTAKSMGSELLTKPDIKERIEGALSASGSSIEQIMTNLSEIAKMKPEKVTGETIVKTNLALLKILGVGSDRPNTPHGNTFIFTNNLNYDQAKAALHDTRGEVDELLGYVEGE